MDEIARPAWFPRPLYSLPADIARRFELALYRLTPKSCLEANQRAELIPANGELHNLMSTQAKRLDRQRQLCPVMSGIGSGSQCLTGLGITAPLQMA